MSPIAIPTVTIADVPVANNCLRHLHKSFEKGERVFKPEADYDCSGMGTFRGATTITLQPLVAAPCDEKPSPIPDNSVLSSSGQTYVRKDGLALYTGRFEIRSPQQTLLFTGHMELMDRIGTHHEPFGTEKCDQEYHIEGWLAGRGSRSLPDLLIRALVVAKGEMLPGAATTTLYGFLNGLIIQVPKG